MIQSFSLLCLVALLLVAPVTAADPPGQEQQPWAEEVLKEDPLVGKQTITLEDLEAAIRDPKRRETVIERHFERAAINYEQQQQFLKTALASDSPEVRRQALDELIILGMLEEVVAASILDIAEKGDEQQRHAAVIALQDFDWHRLDAPAWYRELVQKVYASDDVAEREAAITQIAAWGFADLPELLQQLRSSDRSEQRRAAMVLARILATRSTLPGAGAPPMPMAPAPAPAPVEPAPPPTTAKSQNGTATGPQTERKLEEKKSRLVRVYFGTNRGLVANHPDMRSWFAIGLATTLLGAAIPYLRIRYRHVPDEPLKRRRTAWFTFWCVVAGVAVALWGAATANDAWYQFRSQRVGPEFSAGRSENHKVYYGYCDVSIPPSHQVGLVEQPVVGAEDEAKHVVIERSALLDDQQFFATVRQAIAGCPKHDTFVFVHGYNVSFDQAARRTAQIHYDLDFEGVPLFYSWPSRSNMRLYASDRNEIGYSVEHIRQFLVDVKRRAQPGRIHVVAHSMGAEGVARAIAELGDEGRIFDQIILAAPDIDADVFREQLAPRLAKCSQRTTLYCSRNDWALHASYAFNDSPRVGDSSYGITVREDMDTIDASDIDTDLLGHSYYGDCLPILRDVRLMIEQNLRPEQRELQRAEMPDHLIYWLFRVSLH
jgi:esterase/lipase superfamily enzyme